MTLESFGMRCAGAVAAVFAATVLQSASAADVSGRRMVWAHYVPWLTPDNASQNAGRFYCFPQCDVGADPYRAEVLRALDEGIDGFFNDMVSHKGGETSFWDLRPYLKAAEGTPFHFGICLDAKIPVRQQVKELVKMLSAYGDHPNYPKWKDRYVVDTYTFFAWTADEWKAIRKGCADAGYPIWVIANVETGYDAYDDARLQPYAGLFDCAYFFSNNGAAWANTKSLERENLEAAAFCRRNGALFMPCIWPGYYGGWLNGRCCYYQPFLGFDVMLRRYDCSRTLRAQWLHVTTWNDHDETTLQTRRLATGNPAVVRAIAREFKGEAPAKGAEVAFAYLRETLVGSPVRFEAVRLPASESRPVEVRGRLLDSLGRPVAELSPRRLSGDWEKAEWLVGTTQLAASPLVLPEFTLLRDGKPRTVTLPPAFLATTCLRNPETVKVSESDRRDVRSDFSLSWADGILTGTCDFAGAALLKRAVLYRNDLPVTSWGFDGKTVLPVFFSGNHQVELSVKGGRIACAVKSFETNGAPNFAWSESRIVSRKTPGWMRMTARIEADANTRLSLDCNGVRRDVSPNSLTQFDCVKSGMATLRLVPDGTMYNQAPLGRKDGRLKLSVWSVRPDAHDAFWVEFEFADGTFAESAVKYPFAADAEPVEMDVVETPATLEHTSGASGLPDAKVFLTPRDEWPVRETKVVKAKVSPHAIREERFDFEGVPMKRMRLPQRRWPMGQFRLVAEFTPLADDGADHPILAKNGWNDGPELKLLADGRLAATYGGGAGRGFAEFCYRATSKASLPKGRKAVVTLVNDSRSFALFVDGKEQERVDVAPHRVFGNVSPTIGDGINGEKPTVGLLHSLAFTGNPAAALAAERLTLNETIADHMVFAEGKPIRIFGTGLGKVTAEFRGKSGSAEGTGTGWLIELPPCEAGGPCELTVTLGDDRRVIRDVAVGEVFLVAGQSNVQFPLRDSTLPPERWVDEPLLRCHAVTRPEPGDDFRSGDGWRPCRKDEAGRWSALAYLLGLERVRARRVPVGMIVCTQGASVLRSWLPESLCAEPRLAIDRREMHWDFISPIYSAWNGPGFLYRFELEKVMPYALTHAVWYQGESDTGPGAKRYYADMLEAAIGRWRKDFRDESLPFTVVQIADLDARRDERWRAVQEAQLTMEKRCRNVKVVKTADISCTNLIHPPDKRPLAKRISESMK